MSGHERERLSAYLDRELPPGEQAAVETHLAACPECAAFLAELAAVDEAAASLPAEAPEGYFEAFPARVRSRLETRKAVARRVPAWTWAAAAALLLAVVTPLTVRQLRSSSGAAPSMAPAATQPAPAKAESMAAEASRRPEPTPTVPAARTTSPEKRGPVPAAAPTAGPAEPEAPVAAAVPPEAETRVAKDEAMAQGVFAQEPAAPPAVGGVAREAEANREKGGRDRLHPAAARAAAEPASPALSAATAGAAVEAPDVQEQEDEFRRLESVRPGRRRSGAACATSGTPSPQSRPIPSGRTRRGSGRSWRCARRGGPGGTKPTRAPSAATPRPTCSGGTLSRSRASSGCSRRPGARPERSGGGETALREAGR